MVRNSMVTGLLPPKGYINRSTWSYPKMRCTIRCLRSLRPTLVSGSMTPPLPTRLYKLASRRARALRFTPYVLRASYAESSCLRLRRLTLRLLRCAVASSTVAYDFCTLCFSRLPLRLLGTAGASVKYADNERRFSLRVDTTESAGGR